MSEKEKKSPGVDFFEQLDEALEERKGTDRRKEQRSTLGPDGEDRRKGDRRQDR